MVDDRPNPATDYFVVVSRQKGSSRWLWEIQRRSRPLGVKIYEEGFDTEEAARRAGQNALGDFMRRLGQHLNDR